MKRLMRTTLCFLCTTILMVSCTPSETSPTSTPDDEAAEQIGIEAFSFSVDPPTIVQGQCAVVRWAVEPEGDWPVVFNNEIVEHVDQREVCPERTMEYELWADPPGLDIQEEIITLEVVPPGSGDVGYEGEGEILDFRAEPERIQRGECTQLSWEALAPPDLYFILNGEPVPPSGNKEVCPQADTVYELLLVEPTERIHAHLLVVVEQPAGGAQAATPGPSAPTQEGSQTPTPGPTSPLAIATYQPILQGRVLIIDISLAGMAVSDVQVYIQNTSQEDVDPPAYGEGYARLHCYTTIYSRDQPPTYFSENRLIDAALSAGERRIYPAFSQRTTAGSTIDFTEGWGDVVCNLLCDGEKYNWYSKRLP